MSTALLSRFTGNQTAGITHEVIQITPDMAKKFLGQNSHNRVLRQKDVNKFARDMRSGAWDFNGEPVRIAVDGTLIDGQHRLHAVVTSGVTVAFLLIRGLPLSAQETIDTGVKRTVGDSLHMRGESNATSLAAIARKAILWDAGLRSFSGGTLFTPSDSEIRSYIESNAGLRRAAHVADRSRKHIPVAASVLGVSYFLCSRIDPADTSIFFIDQLTDGLGLRAGDPAHALRLRLSFDALSRRRLIEVDVLGLILRCWNGYRTGERISRIQSPKGGWNSTNIPEPL